MTSQEQSNLNDNIKHQLAAEYPSIAATGAGEGDKLNVNSHTLHIPPMLFGNDVMMMRIGQLGAVSINANDALLAWVAQHAAEETASRALEVIKVPQAKKWSNAAVGLPIPKATGTSSSASDSAFSAAEATSGEKISSTNTCDWTFSSDYCCTLQSNASSELVAQVPGASPLPFVPDNKQVLRASRLPSTSSGVDNNTGCCCGGAWNVQRSTTTGIDYEMLKNRELPILFYDQFILYQDDLEDCGEVIFDAKVRVMPNCWFALSKLYLRVDGVLVRTRETRLFHSFEATAVGGDLNGTDRKDGTKQTVHMEVVWKELRAEGGSAAEAAEAGATSSSVFNPEHRSILLNRRNEASAALNDLIPCINEKEGIHTFYSLEYSGV